MDCIAKKMRTTFTLQRKLEAVKFAARTNNSEAARKFKVCRNQIIRWWKNKALLKAEVAVKAKGDKKHRLSDGGWKQIAGMVNERVRQWILEMRENRQVISRRLIRVEAFKITQELVDTGEMEKDSFSVSLGWLEMFLKRNNFSLHATTTSCQKPPADHIPKIVDFILFLRQLRIAHKYTEGKIFACDETAVWLDTVGKRCTTTKGAKGCDGANAWT